MYVPFRLQLLQYTSISSQQPISYAFDSLMTTEFHTLNGPCSSLVPSGPGYESVSLANQVCSIVGAEPGQEDVIGQRYVELSFDYEFGHVWRVSIFSKIGIFNRTKCAPELRNLVRFWCILHSLSSLFYRV